MRILHTSDWHLGRSFFGQKRQEDFDRVLDWLAQLIEQEQVDALLIAGDIFDNGMPNNSSQEQYYRFLAKLARSRCHHIVIIAGNHDSPSFLDAPKQILHALNVHVTGGISDDPEKEVIVLYDEKQRPEAIVCAVPYLHDRDVRTVELGETPEAKVDKLIHGIKEHYKTVCSLAEKKRNELRQVMTATSLSVANEPGATAPDIPDIPIIAMGHLYASGGKMLNDDGVRKLYMVGTLSGIDITTFPSWIDYVALGHLHIPQIVAEQTHIRYSGSLLPMGFDEATQDKQVLLVDFQGNHPTVKERTVPRFHPLERISGNWDQIAERVNDLKKAQSNAWLEIVYTDDVLLPDLRNKIDELVDNSKLIVCKIVISKSYSPVLFDSSDSNNQLVELNVNDVFQKFLEGNNILETECENLMKLYNEIVFSIEQENTNND